MAAFASIIAMMLVASYARLADAENEVQRNPYFVKPTLTKPPIATPESLNGSATDLPADWIDTSINAPSKLTSPVVEPAPKDAVPKTSHEEILALPESWAATTEDYGSAAAEQSVAATQFDAPNVSSQDANSFLQLPSDPADAKRPKPPLDQRANMLVLPDELVGSPRDGSRLAAEQPRTLTGARADTPGGEKLDAVNQSAEADSASAPAKEQEANSTKADDADPELLPPPAESAQASNDQKSKPPEETVSWWEAEVNDSILKQPKWVKFDLATVLVDTLESSPLIRGVTHRTSIAAERIVQQDAVFDPNMLFDINGGQTNDPVGNILVTGGAPRLQEPSLDVEGGFQKTTRRGGSVGLTQQFGLLDSNSDFFTPLDQGNARLNLSLTQPLFARSGKIYNERLLTQARIDHRIAWQDMRSAVERRIAEVMAAYWRLYELRCHVIQQKALLERGEYIEQVVRGRAGFDAGRVELAKAKQRVARRIDQLIELQAEIRKQQANLAALIGSDRLQLESQMEMIPQSTLWFPEAEWDLRDAVVQGLQYRPEVRAAAGELESAALEIKVTRTELVPQLNAVVEAYLAALNGGFAVGRSLVDQFNEGPGYLAGLTYEMPRGRRAARSRHREAHHRYKQKSAQLQETIQRTRLEIESALIDLRRAAAQKASKQKLLVTATDEESALTKRWEMMAGDGGNVGVVLENLLDAQQRTTDAEREWVTARIEYQTALVDLQRAMGTLLITEAISPIRNRYDCSIDFIRREPINKSVQPDVPAIDSFDLFMNNLGSGAAEVPSTTEQK